ncbi:LOS4 [Canna indica]|uniref:ATP-dependent RNA helicase n=1 Tax=Canna indica TaxID=4628 RepID=A0AAQ3JW12_9LILI|nr:LOS4 [Canna indica]
MVLITTDLLARGFDQRQVNLVINYDLPVKYDSPSEPDCELYLHRVGRTGRFGSQGAAFNLLCTDRDRSVMEKIERHFQHQIPEPILRASEKKEGEREKKAKGTEFLRETLAYMLRLDSQILLVPWIFHYDLKDMTTSTQNWSYEMLVP